ncbi:hypothetical protein [Saccharopolyspora rhizosphaerae]|uniref:hypothetical protein n=1 Tax=Saccharopolyspora rhizosphaerae TaxID=2492662 RepID=UPI0018F385E6|nr:hypothetical protein [Saccharopolyspora rhizosphaerae]
MTGELSASERSELEWLRKENKLLRTEKEVLLRIATEYALETSAPAPPNTGS